MRRAAENRLPQHEAHHPNPCLNEAQTLHIALADLPQSKSRVSIASKCLCIDDVAGDETVAGPAKHGVQHVVGFLTNQGLSRAFMLVL